MNAPLRLFVATLALAFVFSLKIAVSAGEHETPEAVMQAFAARLAEGDYAGAVDLFDSEQRAERGDFVAMVKRLTAINPAAMGPATAPGLVALNAAEIRGAAAGQVRLLVYSLLLPPEFDLLLQARPVRPADPEAAAERLIRAADPARLHGLRLAALVPAFPAVQRTEKHAESVARLKSTYGFDEQKQYFAFFRLDGEYHLVGVTLARYGDWRIASLASSLTVPIIRGPAKRVKVEEGKFEEAIAVLTGGA